MEGNEKEKPPEGDDGNPIMEVEITSRKRSSAAALLPSEIAEHDRTAKKVITNPENANPSISTMYKHPSLDNNSRGYNVEDCGPYIVHVSKESVANSSLRLKPIKVAVASKSCKCGHTFFAARRAADHLPAVEDTKRRTGRVRRSRTQFYDAQHYQKQIKRRSPKKRSLSRSMDYDYKGKEKSESATALARRRRALRRAKRSPTRAGDRTRDSTPQLRPAQVARCSLILQEINRKMTAVTWQPPIDL